MEDLLQIVAAFQPELRIYGINPIGTGHINDTYVITYRNCQNKSVLQRINTDVFKNPEWIIENHLRLMKLQIQDIEIPKLFPSKNGSYLFKDKQGNVWRMMNYIHESRTLERVDNQNEAYETGRGFGSFIHALSREKSSEYVQTIPDFHKLSHRLQQFEESIQNDAVFRLAKVQKLVDFYWFRASNVKQIEKLILNGEVPVRVVHNDTKISNLLFRDQRAVAVIDLDTVGPGSVFFDFGDSIRTIANTGKEDEPDLANVRFNIQYFEKYSEGFLGATGSALTNSEWSFLSKSPIYMTYIMGIRFLTDYLNGDVYYKTNYSEHNLQRSLVQSRLIEQMEGGEKQMSSIIKILFNKYSVS